MLSFHLNEKDNEKEKGLHLLKNVSQKRYKYQHLSIKVPTSQLLVRL